MNDLCRRHSGGLEISVKISFNEISCTTISRLNSP